MSWTTATKRSDVTDGPARVESQWNGSQASRGRVEWTYDPLGRRMRQTRSVWTNNAWAVVEDLKFISDPLLFGRHIAELNAADNALVRTYVWGLDLSGTTDGAGGVGGLLWVTLHTASGPAAGAHFVAYDGNGNIVALSGASDGSETARYEYGPFGEAIRVSGPAATLNPYRFSTKRTDPTIDLVLYEYRVYSPARAGGQTAIQSERRASTLRLYLHSKTKLPWTTMNTFSSEIVLAVKLIMEAFWFSKMNHVRDAMQVESSRRGAIRMFLRRYPVVGNPAVLALSLMHVSRDQAIQRSAIPRLTYESEPRTMTPAAGDGRSYAIGAMLVKLKAHAMPKSICT